MALRASGWVLGWVVVVFSVSWEGWLPVLLDGEWRVGNEKGCDCGADPEGHVAPLLNDVETMVFSLTSSLYDHCVQPIYL